MTAPRHTDACTNDACIIYMTQLHILHLTNILSPYLSPQYYNITNIAVAPYDYFEDINATHPNDPPLLLVIVEQYNEWRFDASTHDIYLSPGTHTCELL